jgi:hypothetical protein
MQKSTVIYPNKIGTQSDLLFSEQKEGGWKSNGIFNSTFIDLILLVLFSVITTLKLLETMAKRTDVEG